MPGLCGLFPLQHLNNEQNWRVKDRVKLWNVEWIEHEEILAKNCITVPMKLWKEDHPKRWDTDQKRTELPDGPIKSYFFLIY